jgi:Mn2+/Fe2+ NRAMP family transporter
MLNLRNLGPGLLFAASAVGVSHLVQSTRAGAEFGFTMAWLIVFACLVKYPAFRFGAEYAAATGESVIEGYERQGRWLLMFFLLAIAAEGLIVIPAVSLVAAGMALNLFGLTANEVLVTMAVIVLSSVALAFGRYRLLENIGKVFVVMFAVLTAVATVAALFALDGGRSWSAPFVPTRDNLFFSVAVAGWMPVGMGGAVFISLWVGAKSRLLGRPMTVSEARLDFNIGYIGTVLLALCFLLMGTALLFNADVELSGSSVGFAAQLVTLFSQSVGGWVKPVIALAALAVMFSTVLAVVDGFPRVYANVTRRLLESRSPATPAWSRLGEDRLYSIFLLLQALVALGLLLGFLSSFGAFIDLATTAGFVVAPAIVYLNHRIIRSPAVPAEARPPAWLYLWSGFSVYLLSAVSLAYLVFRFV